jgi:hypothetical protein
MDGAKGKWQTYFGVNNDNAWEYSKIQYITTVSKSDQTACRTK